MIYPNEIRVMFCILICELKGDSPWSWLWLAAALWFAYRNARESE